MVAQRHSQLVRRGARTQVSRRLVHLVHQMSLDLEMQESPCPVSPSTACFSTCPRSAALHFPAYTCSKQQADPQLFSSCSSPSLDLSGETLRMLALDVLMLEPSTGRGGRGLAESAWELQERGLDRELGGHMRFLPMQSKRGWFLQGFCPQGGMPRKETPPVPSFDIRAPCGEPSGLNMGKRYRESNHISCPQGSSGTGCCGRGGGEVSFQGEATSMLHWARLD